MAIKKSLPGEGRVEREDKMKSCNHFRAFFIAE